MHQQYLEVKVTTASQAELQLMLLDGALRHGKTACETMGDDAQLSTYAVAAAKLLDILAALVQGMAAGKHALSKELEEQFAFLFREAAQAHIEGGRTRLQRVLELIAYHRETWRLACEASKPAAAQPSPVAAPGRRLPNDAGIAPTERVSLQA